MLYADDGISFLNLRFENDVKVDGTQTVASSTSFRISFENDVKVDGTQTFPVAFAFLSSFENDVKVDGTQTNIASTSPSRSLRMM